MLILLTTMCRLNEVFQILLSGIHRSVGGVRITLQVPTKTYNPSNFAGSAGLQTLDIARFDDDKLICPVQALDAYLEKTAPIRGNIDNLFIVLGSQICPARPYTLTRWARNIMINAGLGTFCMKSTRGTSATSGLKAGIPMDELGSGRLE